MNFACTGTRVEAVEREKTLAKLEGGVTDDWRGQAVKRKGGEQSGTIGTSNPAGEKWDDWVLAKEVTWRPNPPKKKKKFFVSKKGQWERERR